MSGARVGRGTRRERDKREVWGRVLRDCEMGGIGLEGGGGGMWVWGYEGTGAGVVYMRWGWEGWSARAEGGAMALAEEGAPPCVLLPSPSSRDFPLAAWPPANPRRAPQSRFVLGGRAGARPG